MSEILKRDFVLSNADFEEEVDRAISEIFGQEASDVNDLVEKSRNVVARSQAMNTCVQVRFSEWGGYKSLSDEELIAMGIGDISSYKHVATRGSKKLVSSEGFKRVKSVMSKVRGALSMVSMPSSGILRGEYIVPSRNVPRVMTILSEGEIELRARVEEYIEHHYKGDIEWMVGEWKKRLPDVPEEVFRNQYPTPETLRAKFHIRYRIIPPMGINDIKSSIQKLQIIKAAESAKEVALNSAKELRSLIATTVSSFVSQIQSRKKDNEEFLNGRTVSSIRRFFGQMEMLSTLTSSEELVRAKTLFEEEVKSQLGSDGRISVEGVEIDNLVQVARNLVDVALDEVDADEEAATIVNMLESPEEFENTGEDSSVDEIAHTGEVSSPEDFIQDELNFS